MYRLACFMSAVIRAAGLLARLGRIRSENGHNENGQVTTEVEKQPADDERGPFRELEAVLHLDELLIARRRSFFFFACDGDSGIGFNFG